MRHPYEHDHERRAFPIWLLLLLLLLMLMLLLLLLLLLPPPRCCCCWLLLLCYGIRCLVHKKHKEVQ